MESTVAFGHALALITAFCWAQNSIMWGYLGKNIGSNATAHMRMWIAVPLMLVLAYMTEGVFHCQGRTWFFLLASGSLGYFVTDLLMFRAYITIGARQSMAIMTLSPVFSAVLSFFLFHQKLSVLQIIALAVIISSVIVLTINSAKDQKGGGEQKQGLLFAVLGALFQAVSLILSKYALDEIGPISTNAIRSIGGLASLFLFAVFRGKAKAEFSAYRHKPKFFLILVAGSLLGPIIGMSCEMKAFTLAPVGTVSALAQTSPLILLFQDKLIFHNKIGLSNAIATLSCIAGITLLFITI